MVKSGLLSAWWIGITQTAFLLWSAGPGALKGSSLTFRNQKGGNDTPIQLIYK